MKKALVAVAVSMLGVPMLGVSMFSAAYSKPAPTHIAPAVNKATSTIAVGDKTITLKGIYAKRLTDIKKTGVTVFYPTSVPPRYTLSSVTISDSEPDKLHKDYSMEFCDKKQICITIESAYSGIGDGPEGDRTLKGKNKILGPFSVFVFKPHSEGNATNQVYYLSSWMDSKKNAPAEKSGVPHPERRFYHFFGNGISDREAVAIVESLMPMN
jgi:hypothetical protein